MKIQSDYVLCLLLAAVSMSASCNEKGSYENISLLALASPKREVSVPAVTTDVIAANLTYTVNIAGTSAIGGGNVTSEGGALVTERGLCWNTAGNPTISDSHATDGSGTGAFSNATMTGLTVQTLYHVRAYATNSNGTAYGDDVSFNSGKTFGTQCTGLQTGYVFYNDGNGDGLVAAETDNSTSVAFFTSQVFSMFTSHEIGQGLTNTLNLRKMCGTGVPAANACFDPSLGGGTAWYLPSIGELELLYKHLKTSGIGGFADNSYWSSSCDIGWPYLCNFTNGASSPDTSTTTHYARAVRAFNVLELSL